MDALRLLFSAGGALLTQAGLHGQLARLEWEEEKSRLHRMLITALLGFASLLSSMVFIGILVMATTWDTVYRLPAIVAVVAVYGLATGLAWRRLRRLSAQGKQAFAATREEFAADMALLRSTQ
jgi:uncharacterized membrane protein YqjE